MRVEFAILADAAQAVENKLYLLGGCWNKITSNAFPTSMQMGLAGSVLYEPNEVGKKSSVTFTIADEAGIAIVPPIEATVEIGRSADTPTGAPLRMVLAVNAGITIPRPGRFTFSLAAGDSSASAFFDAVFTGKKVQIVSGPTPGH